MPDTFSSRRLAELTQRFRGLEAGVRLLAAPQCAEGKFEKHNSRPRRALDRLEDGARQRDQEANWARAGIGTPRVARTTSDCVIRA